MAVNPDPYSPPSSRVDDIPDPEEARRRPKMVWAIAIFYVIGFLAGVASLGFVYISFDQLPPQVQDFYRNLTPVYYVASIGSLLLNLAGAILLFRLSARAPHFLAVSLVIGILLLLYGYFFSASDLSRSFSAIAGQALGLAIVVYAYRLRSRGILA